MYDLLELAGAGGLFGPERRAQLQGGHARVRRGEPGEVYALLIDVAGEDEEASRLIADGAELRALGTRRDSTALTVVEVLRPAGADLPSYWVVDRRPWTGKKHTELHATIVDLGRNVRKARRVVVDATGVGAGPASWLSAALPGKVIPVTFGRSKSDLRWRLVGLIESGRFKEYGEDGAEETRLFWRQLEAVECEVRPGPGKLMAGGGAMMQCCTTIWC